MKTKRGEPSVVQERDAEIQRVARAVLSELPTISCHQLLKIPRAMRKHVDAIHAEMGRHIEVEYERFLVRIAALHAPR
jgi:hypothetical protein